VCGLPTACTIHPAPEAQTSQLVSSASASVVAISRSKAEPDPTSGKAVGNLIVPGFSSSTLVATVELVD
jgi:hypothetical protein